MRASWPRLKPQVLPDREQGLHSLHSPTSQCTMGQNVDRDVGMRNIRAFFLSLNYNRSHLWPLLNGTNPHTDLVLYTP